MAVDRDDAGNVTLAEKKEFGEEGIRPLLRWQMYNESRGEVERVNDHGWGIPLNSGVPLEWEATPYYAGHQSDIKQLIDQFECLIWSPGSSALYQTAKFSSQRLNPVAPPGSSEWQPLRLSLTDSELQWIGTVLLDSNGPEWIYSGQHEFILLSQAQYFGLDQERYDVGEFPLYSIMLVERDNQTGVSTRLGLGRVNKAAWMMANPVLKTVVLG
ncbi:HET-domain-containing protein [Penicillium sp. IBT 16267x]|nr:HET-domain-containing protein [Penicillium sp. IBT 16267x]